MEGLPESGGAGEFGTNWCTAGGAEGSARAGVYLRRHRTLMSTVIERISSAESGLHEAVKSLLTGFEVH